MSLSLLPNLRCGTCKWYRIEEEHDRTKDALPWSWGYCGFNPPIVHVDADGELGAGRPVVNHIDKCSKWEYWEEEKS